MKIYFDGTLINEEYYVDIKKNAIFFNKNFKLGASLCKNYVITLNKEAITGTINIITIYETENNQDVLKETLRVIKIEDVDNYTSKIYAEDSMSLFNFKYNITERFPNQTTYNSGDVFDDICSMAGITVLSGMYINVKRNINFQKIGTNLMARDYLQMLGEISCLGYFIMPNNELAFRNYANIIPGIEELSNDVSEYKIGTKHKITRVVYDGDNTWIYGNTTGETYYINPDNVFIKQASDVEEIYNNIKDIEYYDIVLKDAKLFSGVSYGNYRRIKLNNTYYPFFYQFEDARYYQDGDIGKWIGTVRIELSNEQQQETQIIGTDDKIRTLERTVDYEQGLISQKVGYGEVISSINQSAEQVQINAQKIDLQGYVSFTDLSNPASQTFINGANIDTGTVSCDVLNGGTINGQAISGGTITGTDITATNSFKIGSNQSSTSTDVKYLKMSDNVYLKRTKTGSLETGELYLGGDGAIKILGTNGTFNAILINNGQVSLSNDWGQYVDLNNNDGTVNISSINTSWIDAGNIDCGSGSCSSNGETHINFNKTFTSIPKIIATPNTRTNGVIALKITGKSTTGFDITIGGSGFSNNEPFDWIAMN